MGKCASDQTAPAEPGLVRHALGYVTWALTWGGSVSHEQKLPFSSHHQVKRIDWPTQPVSGSISTGLQDFDIQAHDLSRITTASLSKWSLERVWPPAWSRTSEYLDTSEYRVSVSNPMTMQT